MYNYAITKKNEKKHKNPTLFSPLLFSIASKLNLLALKVNLHIIALYSVLSFEQTLDSISKIDSYT